MEALFKFYSKLAEGLASMKFLRLALLNFIFFEQTFTALFLNLNEHYVNFIAAICLFKGTLTLSVEYGQGPSMPNVCSGL